MNPEALHKISYGMYIVSSLRDGDMNGQIANTVFQVTSEPRVIAVSINTKNLTHEYIQASGFFSVSIVEQHAPLKFIGRFGFRSGRDFAKFQDIEFRKGGTGVPIVVEYAVGFIESRVIDRLDAGTHTLFLGEVVDMEILSDAEPMTYAYYRMVKQGKVPEAAPTYIKEKR
jgi:ferric-chelate reductase [NAD(P)H]